MAKARGFAKRTLKGLLSARSSKCLARALCLCLCLCLYLCVGCGYPT
jgi:hypothetical protein